jgi:hypothetical protein
MFDFNRQYQAANNLRQLEIESQNEALLQRAEVQAQTELDQQQRRGEEADNRYRLNSAWSAQQLSRSKNVVSELGSNFDGATYQASGSGKMKGDEALNPQWLEQNKLRTQTKEAGADAKPGGRPDDDGKSSGRYFRGGKQPADEKDGQANQPQSGQKAPEIANKKQLDALQQKFEDEAGAREGRRDGGERAQQLRRYQENLEMQNAQPAQQPGNYADYGYSQGFGAGGAQMGGFRGKGRPGDPARVPPGPGGGMGGLQGQFMPMQPPGVDPAAANAPPAPPGDAEAIAQVAAGLASLDVRLPQRGRLYRFTTPRGDLEIRARSVPVPTLQRLGGLAAVLAAAFLVWVLAREQSRRVFARVFRWPVFAPALIAAGAISAIVGIFPWAGLAAVVAGVTLVIRRQWPARPATIWV